MNQFLPTVRPGRRVLETPKLFQKTRQGNMFSQAPVGAPGFGIVKLVLTKAVLAIFGKAGSFDWQHICHLKGGKYVLLIQTTYSFLVTRAIYSSTSASDFKIWRHVWTKKFKHMTFFFWTSGTHLVLAPNRVEWQVWLSVCHTVLIDKKIRSIKQDHIPWYALKG